MPVRQDDIHCPKKQGIGQRQGARHELGEERGSYAEVRGQSFLAADEVGRGLKELHCGGHIS